MAKTANNGHHWRQGSVSDAMEPSPGPPPGHIRSRSTIMQSSLGAGLQTHSRTNSLADLSSGLVRSGSQSSTFAQKFVKNGGRQDGEGDMSGIEGENDFSGKRYVWLKDPERAFVRGWVVEELPDAVLKVQCDDGSIRNVAEDNVDKVNPAKFDKADDMAELTHLNEASVVHNLAMRYQADLIYTYSGLFLVTVNPYCPLPIYGRDYINLYKGRAREDSKPHVFAMADEAFRSLVDEGSNQSILVTGESGAGKTENTKKVIQYLAAVATLDTPRTGGHQASNLSEQILRANPILEAFGNAQTVRNNNSSRFGKFIRIEFTRAGQIAGAFIDWYLLEKSRVIRLNDNERNYHVFYQLLRGADENMRSRLFLGEGQITDFAYTKHGNHTISGVSDEAEWNSLIEAFHVMNFSGKDQFAILQTIASILHLGNVAVERESSRGDQASLSPTALESIDKFCRLAGVPPEPFVKGLLHPRVKAGREWVEKVQNPEQVRLALDALAKSIYERAFGDLVDKINRQLGRGGVGGDDTHFIGVLDIAGFEIFEHNSFEQLCINYTNEKLQQFFNHHMFVLEQEEYAREQIEWKFIDFGRDLQPTIDLIELTNPIGLFSCLDEDSVMPRATDKSFTEKLHSLWDNKSSKYRASRLSQGFVLTHYAADVEYSTEGWLEKNKDPLNDNLTRLLAASIDPHMSALFADCADEDQSNATSRSRVKKGLFRTVAQRHKEQLSTLMGQLHSTHPHFIRCILPNHGKRPKQFSGPLVLDQLRCNGVLEGIRIARTGFPNRLSFTEFRARYEVLCQNMPKGSLDGQTAAKLILEKLKLDTSWFRVGLTKVFFRAGVLAELEEQRDSLIRQIIEQFQCVAKGYIQRRIAHKRLYRAEAARIIQRNFQAYSRLQANPWWNLVLQMRPMLGATRQSNEVKRREEEIKKLQDKMHQDELQRQRIEDEKRRTESEIQRVQQTLESERALALDKEEIFRRLQSRENELTEKLQGAIADQDILEEQIDALMEAKKETERQADVWQTQLEQATAIISKLEGEKAEYSRRIAELDVRLKEAELSRSQKTEAEEKAEQEVRLLQSHLSLAKQKAHDLEGKLLDTNQELDTKLATATKDLSTARSQIKELVEENRDVRAQMSNLAATSTSFEDVIRRKDSELSIMKTDLKRFQDDRKRFEDEKQQITRDRDDVQSRLRQVQAEMEAVRSQYTRVAREASDAKKALEQEASATAQAEILKKQITDLQAELFQVQTDLSREQQSRDDVKRIAEAEVQGLQREFDALNDSKVTIEKEMYSQSDILRRANEARTNAESDRRELQAELQKIRRHFIELQEARIESEALAEQKVLKQATERQMTLRRELEDKDRQLEGVESEKNAMAAEVQRLKNLIADSDNFRLYNDQHKERLERELVTIKGRLAASENDNRALMNKVQQKNLDIARSNTRSGDSQRSRLSQLQADKAKADESVKELTRQLNDAQLTISSLEKQKEKLTLSLEDLNHEVTREHRTARNAEQASSTVNLQLAEANRKLETERQLRNQAQTNTRAVQTTLDNANKELAECYEQLRLLNKVFNCDSSDLQASLDGAKSDPSRTDKFAKQLIATQRALDSASGQYQEAQRRLDGLQARPSSGHDVEYKPTNSKRALLEEMNGSHINVRDSPAAGVRRDWDMRKALSPVTTPSAQRQISNQRSNSARSDRTTDTFIVSNRMDLAAELEQTQNKLQMAEMQNRHLQAQVERSPSKSSGQDDSPSVQRIQKLERENHRLHSLLDDSARKVSALENGILTGELSLREVQTKSHEELFELLNTQEQSRKGLASSHNAAVSELADAKTAFEDIRREKAHIEVELRDARRELSEVHQEREQETAGHSQLLQEFNDLQIRLDSETSKVVDLTSSLELYRARSDEYFGKLEQAEIAVLKATRAEQFAKSQAREVEDSCATIMSERKQMDTLIEDLQRQTQQYEERIEDMSTDLDAAVQAKKRLQNELEDYRSQRAGDIEDKEMSMEQTRRKYQSELMTITNELEIERESVIQARGENSRLRDELDELRSKWDDEVLNSSTWAKEKSRLEVAMQDLSNSRDEAAHAHSEAQSKIVSLLGQVRSLRSNVDDAVAERDGLVREKRNLEERVAEASEKLEALLAGEGSPGRRDAVLAEREMLEIKSQLAQQEDIAAAAVGKMRRAEGLAQELQKDMSAERERSERLQREKGETEKLLKESQLKCVDLETKSYSSTSHDVRFLHGRVHELEQQLEMMETTRASEARSVRNVDRTVKDLQAQMERREKAHHMVTEDLNKARDKMERLLATIDELQASDSANQLMAKRAERELREEREKALRLEREVEGWKGLRIERNSVQRSTTLAALSDEGRSRRGSSIEPSGPGRLMLEIKGERDSVLSTGPGGPLGEMRFEVPQRKSSLTKGFL